MFDHIGLRVQDIGASTAFYRQLLAPLGYGLQSQGDGYAGFGPEGAPALWLHPRGDKASSSVHVALKATSREAVQAFHAQGLASGARDNGAPGLRPDYAPNYYAAFLIDCDGNNIEAVCYA